MPSRPGHRPAGRHHGARRARRRGGTPAGRPRLSGAGLEPQPEVLDGVVSYAGRSELHTFLHRTEILVCLLPLTAETVGILDAATFAELPHGACVINVARGQHLVEDDLVQALDPGASPAPPWTCSGRSRCRRQPALEQPKVLVTPHVASYSLPATAADDVAANIRRALAGEPPCTRSTARGDIERQPHRRSAIPRAGLTTAVRACSELRRRCMTGLAHNSRAISLR